MPIHLTSFSENHFLFANFALNSNFLLILLLLSFKFLSIWIILLQFLPYLILFFPFMQVTIKSFNSLTPLTPLIIFVQLSQLQALVLSIFPSFLNLYTFPLYLEVNEIEKKHKMLFILVGRKDEIEALLSNQNRNFFLIPTQKLVSLLITIRL